MQPFRRKSSLEDLGIFGGPPAFTHSLHVGSPNIGDRGRLLDRIEEVLDSKWLTNHGPQSQELERRIAQLVGVKHCIVTCNATVALQLVVRAAGLRGEVIVPSFTFIATAHALQWQGITPVFCDVDPRTHNIDPRHVERLITKRTTGIMGVHLWGRPCDVEALAAVAERHHLELVFDASHAFGCSNNGRMIGGFGRGEVFSFHATKVCNSFEGGAVVTNDDALAEKIRLMMNFGFADYDRVTSIGINAKMSEVSAVMGLVSLESLERFMAANCNNYRQYARGLVNEPGVFLLEYDRNEKCNYHYIVLEIDEAQFGMNRNQLQTLLIAENVLARRYFYPGCHRMEPYRSGSGHTPFPLPETERLASRVLCLPTGTAIGPDEIEAICSLIQFTAKQAQAIKERLAAPHNLPGPSPVIAHA